MVEKEIDISKHILVPKHIKLKEEEAEAVLKEFNITKKQLPRIAMKDPAIKKLDPKKGDIIKITRNSQTAGSYNFYRVVR